MSQSGPTYICCGARVGQPHWGIFGCPVPKPTMALLQDADVRPLPRRDDPVVAWLKRRRDSLSPLEARTVNRLIADYCMKADYGLALDEDGGDP